MSAITSFVVTPGMRAVAVAAWRRGGAGRECAAPAETLTASHASCPATDNVARRKGVPRGLVNRAPSGPLCAQFSMWSSQTRHDLAGHRDGAPPSVGLGRVHPHGAVEHIDLAHSQRLQLA